MVSFSELKSKPPIIMETTGITTSLTRELTIAVKAPPMMIPTARSMTEPRLMNSLNSFNTLGSFFLKLLLNSACFSPSSVNLDLTSLLMRQLYHIYSDSEKEEKVSRRRSREDLEEVRKVLRVVSLDLARVESSMMMR